MLKKILITVVAIITLGQNLFASTEYYKYGEWTPDGHGASDIGGFIDNNGLLGGNKGDEYVFFRENNIGYIYKVEVAGDPNMHPDNPEATGPIAPRTFTYINQFPVSHSYATGGEFYIDDTGIYYGSGRGIKKWDFNLTSQPDEITSSLSSDTLARNTTTGEWWTATSGRQVYKYNNATNNWEYQFTYPSLAGSHHDGMEIVNNQLFLSDMTSDKIIRYDINATTGIVDDTTSYKEYTYTAAPDVEGMGFGPNKHFWIASGWGGTLYEVGGGLKATCSQTFHFNKRWDMQTSQCDDINVPGFDDTLMLTVTDNQELKFITADAGTIAWLASLGITADSNVTLKAGQGFWTYGKFDGIDKTVGNGKLKNNFVSFKNNVYTFAGFSLATDLNSKFGTQPVEKIYYYNGGTWHTWTPADGSQMVPAGQGLYVLPNGDFSILVK